MSTIAPSGVLDARWEGVLFYAWRSFSGGEIGGRGGHVHWVVSSYRGGGEVNITLLCSSGGPQHEVFLALSLCCSLINCFLIAKADKNKASFLFQIAIKKSETKHCFAVSYFTGLLGQRRPPRFLLSYVSKGQNGGFDLP